MVHALDLLHRALRPQGFLLDVRPAPQHPWVVLQRGGRALRLGQVDDGYRLGTLANADAALRTVVAAGRFALERTETFTFTYHFDCAETLLSHMTKHWSSAHLTDALIARVRQQRLEEADELRVLRVVRAERLRRR